MTTPSVASAFCKACVEHVACVARDGDSSWCNMKDTRSSRTGVRARVVRRTFMGLFLLLRGGTSGETAAHVVARLPSHVLTVATPSHGRCGHLQRANTPMAGCPAALPSPSPTHFHSMYLILKHWPKHKHEATLALVHRSTGVEHTPLTDTCNRKFWIVFLLRNYSI